jgi:hypothetical protein
MWKSCSDTPPGPASEGVGSAVIHNVGAVVKPCAKLLFVVQVFDRKRIFWSNRGFPGIRKRLWPGAPATAD